jgi:ribonuclease E
MEKNLYIDASHPNETRVVLKSENNIEDYEYEGLKNTLIKNNIYLGKVSRIEPSLQAALLTLEEIGMDFYHLMTSNQTTIKSLKVI